MSTTAVSASCLGVSEMKSRLGFNEVDVRKVDFFQGQDRSVVILDVTFTDKLGFMAISNRLNVAKMLR